MAKEATAISQLIFLARQRPIMDLDDEVTIALPEGRPPTRPVVHGFDDDHQVTHRISRRDMKKPLIAATIAAASIATFGITVRLTRRAPEVQVAAAAAAPAAPAPAEKPIIAPPPAPVVAPAPPPPAPKPALVDLALESQPAGATVIVVDRGQSSLAGTTPLSLSLDPSRQYDVVFTLAGRAPKLEHVDPHATQHVAVELPAPEAAPAPAPVETPPAPPPPPRHHVRAHAQARAAAAPKPSGTGVLMISAKPPCDITIDGESTGLVTPQRAIRLAAGPHKITLSNAQEHIKSSMTVTISANYPTKLIRDLMNK
jgi:hypothetical protein